MTKEKWQEIKGKIKDGFSVEEEGSDHLDEEGGIDIDFIVFQGPLGRMRLEFISRPVILDKKTTYAKRIGSETKVDYVYSENERSEHLAVYRWDSGLNDWAEMEANNFTL